MAESMQYSQYWDCCGSMYDYHLEAVSDALTYGNGIVTGGWFSSGTNAGISYEYPNHTQYNVGSLTHQLFNKSILICYYNT